MKALTTAITLSSLFFGTPVTAGSGHDHGHSHAEAPVDKITAETNADKVIISLVKREKIDKSWSNVKANSIEKKMLNDHPEWVVIFINENITDVDKQKLYVFLTIGGEYIAANYTGN